MTDHIVRLRQIDYHATAAARDLEWLRGLAERHGTASERDRLIDAIGRLAYISVLIPHEAREVAR